jgi:divalent metal cation (Fe/Co/Zn/Cd) transporter
LACCSSRSRFTRDRIAESADLRGRAAQTLVIFAALLLIALLLAIPEQSQRVLGVEFLLLAVLVTVGLLYLDRVARQTDSPRPIARTLQSVNPSMLTALGIALAGGLMVFGVDWADSRWSQSSARRWSAG